MDKIFIGEFKNEDAATAAFVDRGVPLNKIMRYLVGYDGYSGGYDAITLESNHYVASVNEGYYPPGHPYYYGDE